MLPQISTTPLLPLAGQTSQSMSQTQTAAGQALQCVHATQEQAACLHLEETLHEEAIVVQIET